jgi:hypothetical protein
LLTQKPFVLKNIKKCFEKNQIRCYIYIKLILEQVVGYWVGKSTVKYQPRYEIFVKNFGEDHPNWVYINWIGVALSEFRKRNNLSRFIGLSESQNSSFDAFLDKHGGEFRICWDEEPMPKEVV